MTKGSDRAAAAGAALAEIEAAAVTVANAIDRIAASTNRQSEGMKELDVSVRRVNTGLNSLTELASDGSEQSARLAEEVKTFEAIVDRFSTRDPASSSLPPPGTDERRHQRGVGRRDGNFAAPAA